MQNGVNIEEVKKYNASLRQYRDKANQLKAEIEFTRQELEKRCATLSSELGVQVTPDNIESILADRINKINNTMAVGNDILKRIQDEEQAATTSQVAQQVPTVASQPAGGAAQVMPCTVPSAPQAPNSVQMPQAPNIGQFDGELPPIFANR